MNTPLSSPESTVIQHTPIDGETSKDISNRFNSSPVYVINTYDHARGQFGYDRVACLIPIDSSITNLNHKGWTNRATEHAGVNDDNPYLRSDRTVTFEQFPDAKVFAQVRSNGSQLRLEFNPSHFPNKSYGLGTRHTIDTLIKMTCASLEGHVIPEWAIDYQTGEITSPSYWKDGWQQFIKITRLDIAYDFIPPVSDWNLRDMQKFIPKYKAKVHAVTCAGRVESLTIQYGKKNGRLMTYDKHRQDPTFPAGTMRMELQARAIMLKKAGIITLNHLTDSRAHDLLATRQDLARWNLPVNQSPSQLTKVSSLPISWERKIDIIGYMTARDQGIETGIPPRSRKEYEALLLKHGLS